MAVSAVAVDQNFNDKSFILYDFSQAQYENLTQNHIMDLDMAFTMVD